MSHDAALTYVEMDLRIREGFVLGASILGTDTLVASGGETWVPYACDAKVLRVNRGGSRDGLVPSMDVGTLSATLVNAGDPLTDPLVKPNTVLRLRDRDGEVLFTGAVQDVHTVYDRDGNTFVNLLAADAVQSLANTNRYGAVVDNDVEYEPWASRIARLATSARTTVNVPAFEAPTIVYSMSPTSLDGWARFGTVPANLTPTDLTVRPLPTPDGPVPALTNETTQPPNSTVIQGAYTYGLHRPITGLTVGRIYTVRGYGFRYEASSSIALEPDVYALGVHGKGNGAPVTLPFDTPTELPPFTFTATSTTHTIRCVLAEEASRTTPVVGVSSAFEAVALTGITLEVSPEADAYMLGDTVYESTLLNHFDLASNSVGAVWWVDRDNVTQFKRLLDTTPAVAHLSDVHDATDPLHVCFTSIEASYDTRNVFNDLRIENHGRQENPDRPGEYIADDIIHLVSDEASAAAWGARSASFNTNLYDEGVYAGSVAARGQEILDAYATPEIIVTRVEFNAFEFQHIVAALDIYSQVTVTARGHSGDYLVVAIEHDISPNAWNVTLDLTKKD